MSAAPTEPYETLAALIERQLQLVSERSFDELQELKHVREELQSSLPATPPAAAGPILERCTLLQKRVEIELLRVREALLLELRQVQHGRRAAQGYKPLRNSGRRVAARA